MSFKPMLAASVEDVSALKYPLLASPKIDGIRCIIVNNNALSRSLKPIPNAYIRQYLESIPELEGMDGELIVGKTFQETTSAVMSHDGEPDFVYRVFDNALLDAPFAERLASIPKFKDKRIQPLLHTMVTSETSLLDLETEWLADGHEGIMLRDPNGSYKHGRSTFRSGGLMKLKRFTDAEATIIGFEERMHNTNEGFTNELGRTTRSTEQAGLVGTDMLGAFVCKNASGIIFKVGTGLDDDQRHVYWHQKDKLVGKLLKYKSFLIGEKDAPRFPVFLGFRDLNDL